MGSHPAPSTPVSAAADFATAPLSQAATLLARRLVAASGGRNTTGASQCACVLIASDRALSHAEIEAQLVHTGLDRVTLYRVLDWLVERSLAHRVGTAGGAAGVERAMRFAFTRPEKPHSTRIFSARSVGARSALMM